GELFDAGAPPADRRAGAEPLAVELLADVVGAHDASGWLQVPGRALPMRGADGTVASVLRVRLAAARSQERPGRFFLLVDADDERLVVPEVRDGVRLAGDELVVEYGPDAGAMQTLSVQPVERPGGWMAEIGFDAEPALLRVRITDVDYLGSRRIEGQADSGLLAPVRPFAAPTRRDRRPALWADAVRGLARASGRVSVFDASGAMLAQSGSVSGGPPPADDWTSRLARRLLSATLRLRPERFLDGSQPGSEPAIPPLTRALSGLPAQQSERIAMQAGLPVWMLTSAQPLWVGDRVVGALVLEENTGS